MLCLGGIDASLTPVLAQCAKVSGDVVRLTFVAPADINPNPLEHPPRI
jgi:hypothetical protein